MAWDDTKKAEVIKAYKDENPTPENSAQIVKDLAEKFEESPNGVRMILTNAGVYLKKAGTTSAKTDKETGSIKTPRVSKEAQHDALRAEITRIKCAVDDEIIEKMTGKAAAYFVQILKTV